MKKNYAKLLKRTVTFLLMFFGFLIHAQDIHFTFANAQSTNDGSFDYYEVDVMMQTENATGSFKLGSGQLYFNYSTAAFGMSVFNNSNIEITQPNDEGYIAGQFIDAAAAGIYGSFTINDNTDSRVSWSFSQVFSFNTFAADNVTSTPTKLCHIKLKYADINEVPLVMFETGNVFDDQFETACGGTTGGAFELADCAAQPGVGLLNDTFDNTLSNTEYNLLTSIKLYPNPVKDVLTLEGDLQKLTSLKLFALSGQLILNVEENFNSLDMSTIESGIYFLRINTLSDTITRKVVKE